MSEYLITKQGIETRKNVSVVIECGGRKFRVIDNLRELVGGESERSISEARIGRKVLDLARTLEVEP
jgi:hypothetical protein